MCLTNPKRIPIEEDIVVFKFLINRAGGTNVSPFYYQEWVAGIIYDTTAREYLENTIFTQGLHGGVYHSYKYAWDALVGARAFWANFDARTVVGKFVIPKDAVVFIGLDNQNNVCYASDRIRFEGLMDVKEIEDNPDKYRHPRTKEWAYEQIDSATSNETNITYTKNEFRTYGMPPVQDDTPE